MTAPPSIPQPPLDDVPRVQQFLELAAPLFLDRRQLDERAWGELRGLARQTGLSTEELERVVKSLQKRGVISDGVSPPLSRPAAEAVISDAAGLLEPTPPPAAVPPIPPPPPTATARVSNAPNARWAEADERKLFSSFLERARAIIAERQGMDSTTYAILADVAHSHGLTEQQFDEAVPMLCGSQSVPTPPSPPPGGNRATLAAPRDPRPDETFRKYLKLAIQDKHRSKGYISEGVERKLVDEGVRKLGLSPVYSRHLVHEIAEQCGTTVISQQDADSAQKDPQFDQFLSRAMPVFAQQRGMNPRARVMLLAIAQEMELPDEAVDRAVGMLHRATPRTSTTLHWRNERREAYRGDLRRILASSSGGMLPPTVVEDLMWRGQHLYGLDTDTARDSLHETAVTCNVTILSPEQALKSMALVVQDRLGARTRLTADDEWEIFNYGEQLGLEQDQLRAIVRRCVEQSRRRRIRERNLTMAMLVFGGLAAVGLLAVFYATLMNEDWRQWLRHRGSATPKQVAATPSETETATSSGIAREQRADSLATPKRRFEADDPDELSPVPRSNPAEDLQALTASSNSESRPYSPETTSSASKWLDAELSVLLVAARRASPPSRQDDLQQIEIGTTDVRAAAYERLAAAAVDEREADRTLGPIGHLLVGCVLKDPEDRACRRLILSLSNYLPNYPGEPPESVEDYHRTFAAMHVLVAAAEQPELSSPRVSLLQEHLSGKLGESLAVSSLRGEFKERCISALVRRLYQVLASAAPRLGPMKVMTHVEALEPMARRHLSFEDQEHVITQLLVAGLPTAGDEWPAYRPLLDRSATVEDPTDVLKLLQAFEAATDEDLKEYLAMLLEPHMGATDGESVPLEDIPARVRSALGASALPERTRDQCLIAFRAEARGLLDDLQRSSDSDEVLIQQISKLARLAAQGMVLAGDDLATYQQLANEPKGEETSPDATPVRPAVAERAVESSAAQISEFIDMVRRTRRLDVRMQALDRLASLAPTTSDIHPDQADILATYYVSHRSDIEHPQRITRLKALKNWNNLRLAVAHEVGKEAKYEFQLEEVVNELSEAPIDAPHDGQWPKRARAHLLREGLQKMSEKLPGAPAGEGTTLDHLRSQLQQIWTLQAKFMRVDLAELKAAGPSQQLKAMILAKAEALKGTISDAAGSKELAEIPHRLTAIEFVATQDLERTIHLDRVWVQLLALQIDAELRGHAAADLAKELQQSHRNAAGLLQQLRLSQATLVRMWLLRLERTSS